MGPVRELTAAAEMPQKRPVVPAGAILLERPCWSRVRRPANMRATALLSATSGRVFAVLVTAQSSSVAQ
jgi:hypothetical protein